MVASLLGVVSTIRVITPATISGTQNKAIDAVQLQATMSNGGNPPFTTEGE